MKIIVDVGEQLDDIIRENLEWCAENMLKEGHDVHETLDNKAALFSALCQVIEFYSTPSEYKEFQ
jgi:hypothetical protein